MKYCYVGLILLGLLIAAGWAASEAVASRAEALIRPLELADQAMLRGDERAVRQHLGSVWTLWEQSRTLLSCLLSHSCTDRIGDGLQELQLLQDEAFRLRCAALIRLLGQVRELDRPRLGNIF